jgi:hypothetical protein
VGAACHSSDGAGSKPPPAAVTAAQAPVAAASASAIDAGSRDAAPEGAAPVPDTSLAAAPLLDAQRGRRATNDYCASFGDAGPPECGVPGFPEAIASGSFYKRGADEVLLVVPNGEAAAWGENSIAVMRREGAHYRDVRELLHSSVFRARLRIVVPGGLDELMLCDGSGHGDLYRGQCGFLGEGSFREGDERVPGPDSQLPYIGSNVCGPQWSVEVADPTFEAGLIHADVVVVQAVLVKDGPDDGYTCSKETRRREQRYPMVFALDEKKLDSRGARRVERLTEIPDAVGKVLMRF